MRWACPGARADGLSALTVAVDKPREKGETHDETCCPCCMVALLLPVGLARAQESFPIMEQIAQKIIEKYQTSSCQELAQQKNHPPTGEQAQIEQRALQILRSDPQMRTAFLNRVAAPIANKLFECGLIP